MTWHSGRSPEDESREGAPEHRATCLQRGLENGASGMCLEGAAKQGADRDTNAFFSLTNTKNPIYYFHVKASN